LDPQEWVVLATVERSRGLRGEIVVLSSSGGPETFLGRSVYAGERPSRVEEAWLHGTRLILKLEGIDSIEAADALRGVELRVPRAQRLPLGDGEYYLSDLVGCELFDAGKPVGEVTGWYDAAGSVLLAVTHDSHESLIPFVKEICREIDLPNRRILAELPAGLLDL
jgi:16S rRNA processing protein RimM